MMFLDKNYPRGGFDYVVREDFAGKTSTSNYPVLAAWNACERAASRFALTFNKYWKTPKAKQPQLGISATRVKALVAGAGGAEKKEVEAAVRRMTGYTDEFANFDESDAAAIGLAWLIHEGVIDKPGEDE
ncbi:crossover junction endodeoxyribonuclease RuvC [Bacillus velezensis]|uniref:crossover junction endodeoxyribonuclease RuvC n=1 Tax=Bacillus velezensis TaxID=492670 RepID=UPI001CCF69BE|nr:crossover junction endodeoxyribonuclease RuvC [Bacillus velezensis]UBM56230.1 crossover junction endodeoxyribonuclease RuvC [Bacillus velezensis]